MSWLLKRLSPMRVLLAGSVLATLFMAASGFFTSATALLLQRGLAGVASALVFSTGGLLAARLGARQPHRSGFLLGLYYGGTGLGIVVSALGVPWLLERAAGQPHGWAWAWWGLALLCALVAILALYRAGSFIHELTHLRPDAVPGFNAGWNALVKSSGDKPLDTALVHLLGAVVAALTVGGHVAHEFGDKDQGPRCGFGKAQPIGHLARGKPAEALHRLLRHIGQHRIGPAKGEHGQL